MKSKLFSTLAVALSLFAFVSCGDKESAAPAKITLDKTSIDVQAGGTTTTVSLTSNTDWTLADYSDDVKAWLTITPTSGKASGTPQTISIKVQPNTGADRNANVTFYANVLANQSLKISQAGEKGDVESLTVAEFIQKGDTENAYRLKGQITEFKSGQNSSGVTYYQFNLQDASGKILVYSFTNIEQWLDKGISKNGNIVTLTGKYQWFADKSQHEVVKATIEKVEEGQITRPTDIIDVTVAEFLNKPASETVWYRLTGTVSGSINTQYGNFDIVQNGASVYFYGADNINEFASRLVKNASITVVGHRTDYNKNGSIQKEMTGGYIEDIADAAPIEKVATEGVIVGLSRQSYILQTASEYRYIYSEQALRDLKLGDQVKVEGDADVYNGLPQISNPVTTVQQSGVAYTLPEPIELDAAKLDAYDPTDGFKMVKVTGDLTASGNYYNVKVKDAGRTVSLAYPADSLNTYVGKTIDVTGFFVGISGTIYYNILLTDVKVSEHQTPVDKLSHPLEPGVAWVLGDAAYDNTSSGQSKQTAQVNKVEVSNLLKLGSSKKNGTATLNIPAGKTKIGFYAGGWKTTQAEEQSGITMSTPVKVTIGSKTIDIKRNDGCTGNPKYTVTFSDDADYYEVEVPEGAVTITADARAIFVGITAY